MDRGCCFDLGVAAKAHRVGSVVPTVVRQILPVVGHVELITQLDERSAGLPLPPVVLGAAQPERPADFGFHL